jgi:FkbM family methyltransferase
LAKNKSAGKLVKYINVQLRKCGYMIAPDKFSENHLQGYKFNIATLIDIGVGSGTPSLYNLFRDSQIVMIDPHPDTAKLCAVWLENTRFNTMLLNCAAGESEAELSLTLHKSSSSFFERIGSVLHHEKVTAQVYPLDSLATKHRLKGPFGIKIDTEGFELGVIRGALNTLKNTEFVIAEVSVKERFVGGYTFSEFIGEMAQAGFEVTDMISFPAHSRYVDVLFVPRKNRS